MIKHGLIEPKSIFSFTADAQSIGQRVDSFLAHHFTHYSRSYFQRLIDSQAVSINGSITKKQGTALKEGDTVTIVFPDTVTQDSPHFENDAAISCIHKDEHFIVVAKSANVVTHKPNATYTQPTLVDWLTKHFQEIGSVGYIDRPGIVHRLDKDTSGLMLIARTNYGHTLLSQLFKQRAIKKTYIALVHGHPPREGSIDLPIGRHPIYRTKMAIFPKKVGVTSGSHTTIRHALTHYQVLHYFDTCSLVKVMPVTGRTHQIRVHFSALGHPLLGDVVYHKSSPHIARQALHAYELTFSFDDKEHFFTANPPEDFLQALRELGTQSQESSPTPIPFIQ